MPDRPDQPRPAPVFRRAILTLAFGLGLAVPTASGQGEPRYVETPVLADAVAGGTLPPIEERLPRRPRIVSFDRDGLAPGRHGGELRTLVRNGKDVKLLVVYGYARLVGYTPDFELVPDILEDVEVEEGRIFTLRLRPGHKWSDGHPFTSEDFRYWWDDVANNPELSPAGLPKSMLLDGAAPRFEVLDKWTVRYTWDRPNPFFLPRLAAASPLFIYRPAHYLRQFHERYGDPETLAAMVKQEKVRNWAALHDRRDNLYLFNNPDQPTLQPWTVRNAPPATRFVAERNPFFHRVDEAGRQLPYIDRVVLAVTASALIPAKTAAGDSDLQSRGLSFQDYALLQENARRSNYRPLLWRMASGAQIALFPNLNVNDPAWRKLLRDVRFRRALSLAIDRYAVNEFLFFGLGREGNNTVLEESKLYRPEYRTAWTKHDPDRANALLDELGLTDRNAQGIRLLPDGRPLEIIVETAGEQTTQVDFLELIEQNWAEVGVKLFSKPSHRATLRARVSSGETMMSVWTGLLNAVPTADSSPEELVPSSRIDFQWPKWGLYEETGGTSGEPVDLADVKELLRLNTAWLAATDRASRAAVWHEMLRIHAEQVFSIGIISGVRQPVVVSNRLMNVPAEAIYNWDPGAIFGVYRPDTFWFK